MISMNIKHKIKNSKVVLFSNIIMFLNRACVAMVISIIAKTDRMKEKKTEL